MREDEGTLLKLERPFADAVMLCDLDSELTFLHGAITCSDPEWFETFFGPFLRKVSALAPTTRLHKDHVLLLRRPAQNLDIATALQDWLQQRGLSSEPLRLFRTRSEHPIEDGFFTCLCAATESLDGPRDFEASRMQEWQEFVSDSPTIGRVVADFADEEFRRFGGHLLMQFLEELYSERHLPKMFDTETAHLEFAVSVYSANEVRIWSRPVQCPK